MLIINSEIRKDHGKGASRRLRITNKIPAIVYGGIESPLSIELNHDTILNAQTKIGFYSDILILLINEKKIKVKLQAVQYHPFKSKLIHIDFVRM